MERIVPLKEEILPQINLDREQFDTFHERLKELRENRIENRIGFRLKQNEAAYLLDQLAPNYNRIERGLIKPSVDIIIQISEIFGVTTDFLIKGKYAKRLYVTEEETESKPKGKGKTKTEEAESKGEVLEAYKQVIEAKDRQIEALNSLIENLTKENQRLQQ